MTMSLAEGGVLSVGCKIGRRSAVLLLADFRGTVRQQLQITHAYPLPERIFTFLREGLADSRLLFPGRAHPHLRLSA
ncbi:hypothetical protein JP75_01325 [Devosia riboflavina]|uniref:Uncharacterized protein n=1 Tax=Devosia riboflavina TaxID=46914 RepID=A0A087M7G2_9HYPH|nr:hypothetical protein [Devosia riboflavina]KFL32815.1 hypothetical protein JP75_01325 [Devosia riboflavina]